MTETDQCAPPSTLGEGTVLSGRYRLRRLLGRGGMAEVYLARDDVLNRQVAVKVFRSGTTLHSDAKRQQLEAELLARLSHPGLVTVFDAGFDADEQLSFLVMEIVEGPTLAARLAAGPLHESHVQQVGASLAEALAHVHEHGVVHRDVKPGNVLFSNADDHNSVKLADFGIARMADSARLTHTGLIVGSAHYLSPEQARGEDAGPPCDIYALGLVLLECLTGAPVFPGAGVEPVVARLHRDPQVPDDVDPALGRLLTAMTSRDAAQRPTARDVAAALGQAPNTRPWPRRVVAMNDRGETTGTHQIGAAQVGQAGRGHRWNWVAAACGAILVASAGAGAMLGDPSPGEVEGTVVRPPTASPDATRISPASPTPTPSTSTQPAAQPAGAPGDTSAKDNGNGKSEERSNGKSKGNEKMQG
ncbi:MAG TPA: serine/threonine-protein kinase [Jiangellaceae bacterium]|nr:serine/threonine-protein kinase [Jiangellaceae bacterium]